jgi:hypothetical protein
MQKVSRHLTTVLLFVVMSRSVDGQSSPDAKGWGNLSRVPTGSQVRVELFQPKTQVKGTLSSWDGNGITVESANGKSETIGKPNIRRIQAKGRISKYAPVIGAAAGAITLGVITSRPRFDFVSSFVAVCAAVGGLAGFGVGMSMRYSIVYEMP